MQSWQMHGNSKAEQSHGLLIKTYERYPGSRGGHNGACLDEVDGCLVAGLGPKGSSVIQL